ncbi:MAG: hypothetical protein QOF55_50 [Thermoleophilaceae bacterium]|jgi:hypothetical protein|nr:hypothetical protein [Thermoleophilaceae bacterium]MEA2457104.1 hypothetical protein [Thermoleophilaceae bacterium]
MAVPLAISALLFAVLATAEWGRLPVVARIYLGVATAFAIGAVVHPGMSVAAAVNGAGDGLAYLLGAARAVGFAAVLVSVATFLRGRVLG